MRIRINNEIADEESVYAYLKEYLSGKRLKHVMGVRDVAIALAERYHVDVDKVSLAALFHDCSKSMSAEDMVAFLEKRKHDVPEDHIGSRGLMHAAISMFVAKEEFKVTDAEILNAVRWHTVGNAGMGMVEKILYMADYLEPNRNLVDQKQLTDLAMDNFNKALLEIISRSIYYILETKRYLAVESVVFYNEALRAVNDI